MQVACAQNLFNGYGGEGQDDRTFKARMIPSFTRLYGDSTPQANPGSLYTHSL